jgi:hypothetical protein
MTQQGEQDSMAQLIDLAQKYRKLVILKNPSDDELNEIDQILELAIYDDELCDLIDKINQEIAKEVLPSETEVNLLGKILLSELANASQAVSQEKSDFRLQYNDCVIHHTSYHSSKNHLLSEEKALHNSRNMSKGKFLISALSVLAIGLISHCVPISLHNQIPHKKTISAISPEVREPNSIIKNIEKTHSEHIHIPTVQNERDLSNNSPSEIWLVKTNNSNDNYEVKQNLKHKFTDPEVQKIYVNLQQLEINSSLQDSHRLAVKIQAKKIQSKAEFRQMEAERRQINAEKKQLTAELENHNDLAIRWHIKAQAYFRESQQWLSLSKNSVAIVKQL